MFYRTFDNAFVDTVCTVHKFYMLNDDPCNLMVTYTPFQDNWFITCYIRSLIDQEMSASLCVTMLQPHSLVFLPTNELYFSSSELRFDSWLRLFPGSELYWSLHSIIDLIGNHSFHLWSAMISSLRCNINKIILTVTIWL